MIKKFIGKVFQDDFLRNNAVFFVGSLLVAFLNFLYHPIISRLVSVEEFGELQSLFSLFIQAMIFVNVFGLVITQVMSTSDERRSEVTQNIYTFFFYVSAVVCALALPFTPQITSFFSFTNPLYFPLLITSLLLGIPAVVMRGTFQGEKDFWATAILNLVLAAGKLLFAAVFLLLGLGIFGAWTGFLLAVLASCIYGYIKIKKKGLVIPRLSRGWQSDVQSGNLIALLTLTGTGLITILYTSDIIIAKRLFDSELVGLYSGVSTIGKIVFFVTASVSAVLLPSIKASQTRLENHTTLMKGLGIISLLGIGGCGFITLFPNFTINLLIGGKFTAMAHLLPFMSWTVLIIAITNLFVFYFIALRNTRLIPISVVLFFGFTVLTWINNSTPAALIQNTFVISTLFCISLGSLYIYEFKRTTRESTT